MDASIHVWLEGRGEEMVLISMIDDAASRVLARFYPANTTEAHLPRSLTHRRPTPVGRTRAARPRKRSRTTWRTADRRALRSHSRGALSSRRRGEE
jgi:hypothetical protein